MMDEVPKARIWSYAKAMNKSVSQVLPEDFRLEWPGMDCLKISCSIKTSHEAEAVCELIMMLTRNILPSSREMVRGDIHLDEPKPSFKEQLQAMFGPCVSIIKETPGDQPGRPDEQVLEPDDRRSRELRNPARAGTSV